MQFYTFELSLYCFRRLIVNLATKGLALGLTIYLLILANYELNEQINKFQFSQQNKSVISNLEEQVKNGNAALVFMFLKTALLIVDEAKNIFIGM